jgi:putative endonuclease
MSFWIYMLRCANGSYYVGHTDNLEKRLAEHHAGQPSCYTTTRRPVVLVSTEEFPTHDEVLEREMQIKGWRRAKKEALIHSDWAELSRLSSSAHPSTSSG